MSAKKRMLGGREYFVLGSTIEWDRGRVVRRSYTTAHGGRVVIEGGIVTHIDGLQTDEDGRPVAPRAMG